MAGLNALAFASPWVLAALAILPIIYWLLKAIPPSPRRITFPAIRLLFDLRSREETPDRTPWWLLALRLLAASLIIVALARPVLNPGDDLPGDGPVILVVDTGWSAAANWTAHQDAMASVIDRAARQERLVAVLPTARAADGAGLTAPQLLRPADARSLADGLEPAPWPPDRTAAARALADVSFEDGSHIVWASDGLDAPGTSDLVSALTAIGSVSVLVPDAARTARLIAPPEFDARRLRVPVYRAAGGEQETQTVSLIASDGRLLDRQDASFSDGETSAAAVFDLPADLRNEAVRVEIDGAFTAGAVALLDERWRRRPVGIIGNPLDVPAQPLLDERHYLTNALAPFSEIRVGSMADLTESGVAALFLTDTGALSASDQTAAEAFMAAGGVLLRLAGPRRAAAVDPLTPVPLRSGDRSLSGALTWSEPMRLSAFDENSPFADIPIPDDIRVQRQVLAEPTGDLSARTWARLEDGTPLVTADRRGDGWLILIHTTATPEWSNLPISGLFVEMLRRSVALSQGEAAPSDGDTLNTLNPLQTLNAIGQLGPPPATVLPISITAQSAPEIGPRHPPGFYGAPDARRAISLGAAVEPPAPIALTPAPRIRDFGPQHSGPENSLTVSGYAIGQEIDLLPWLATAALFLLLVDGVIALILRGLGPVSRRAATTVGGASSGAAALALIGALAVLMTGVSITGAAGQTARAADDGGNPGTNSGANSGAAVDERTMLAATNTWLAYVQTGVPQVDEVSRAGLEALAVVLRSRTSVNAAGAMAVDLDADDLTLFPLLYWPIPADHADLRPEALERLNDYLRHGGMIVFDTRDSGLSPRGGLGSTPAGRRLQSLASGLDIPVLETVPEDHVLTRAFYLINDFPGRYPNGDVWVETPSERVNDGVSGVVIGGGDWASAWARDDSGRPLFPIARGGERQREMAYRFGVNLVLYALTGNYKADQVHVPAILERLTQ